MALLRRDKPDPPRDRDVGKGHNVSAIGFKT